MTDDAILLDRYATARDAEAFAELVRRHAGLVHGTCRRVCRDAANADDAAQECFLLLARHAGRIRSSLPAWLHLVAVRTAVRLRRRSDLPLAAAPEPATPELEAWRRLAPLLDEALADLPEEQRAALALRYLEGRTQAEIAAQLGLSQPTVSRRLDAGVCALRERLGRHLGVVPPVLLLDRACSEAPAPVVAAAVRIGLSGVPVQAARRTLAGAGWWLAALVSLAFAGLWWRSVRPTAPTLATVAAEEPPRVAAPGLLDRPVTCSLQGWQLGTAVDVLLDQLAVQAGERIELMPSTDEASLVSLACEAAPLRTALDQLARTSGWRWRVAGTVAYLDRPLPEDERARLLAAITDAAPAEREERARALVRRGDLDACGALLALLADERWDAPGADAPDLAVLHALADAGATWQDWRPRGNPLGLLAEDPAAQRGVGAAWRRCRRLQRPLPPFLCYLAGTLRVRELVPDLLHLARDPQALLPGLSLDQPLQAQVVGRTRQWAILALGRLGDASVAPELAAMLAADPGDPAALALVAALGALGHREALPTIAAMPVDGAGDWYRGVCLYVATLRLDPRGVAAQVARGGMMDWGFWDGYIGFPVPDLLPRVLTAAPRGRWWEEQAFWSGTSRLPAELVSAATNAARANAANGPARIGLDALLARAGDDAALERVVAAALAGDELPFALAERLAARLGPQRGRTLAERVAGAIDLAHASEGGLGLVRAMPPPDWDARLIAAWPTAEATARSALARALAHGGTAAGRDFLLERLAGEDGGTIAAALGWSELGDPLLRRRLVTLLPRLPRATSDPLAPGLACHRDSAEAVATILAGLPLAEVRPELAQALAGLAPNYLPDGSVTQAALAMVPVLQRWLQPGAAPELRTSSIGCLAGLLHGDLRAMRVPVLTALIALARGDQDHAVRDAASAALAGFVAGSAMPDGRELFTEAAIMAGSLDDRDEVRPLETALTAAQAAIAAPAADLPVPAGVDF